MVSATEQITILPALCLFVISSYLAFSTAWVVDSSTEKTLLIIATCLFIGGLILAVCWVYYWTIHKTGNVGQA
jgi:hypothetical protein